MVIPKPTGSVESWSRERGLDSEEGWHEAVVLEKLDNPEPNGRDAKHREQQGQREEIDDQRVVPMNGLPLVNRVVAEHEADHDEDVGDEAEIDLSANLAGLYRER